MIDQKTIFNDFKNLLIEINHHLPDDYRALLKREFEASGENPDYLELILRNEETASAEGLPLCQDCGTVCVNVRKGRELCLDFSMELAVNSAVREVYTGREYRCSQSCSPIERANTGDNTPVVFSMEETEEQGLTVEVMIKGGGSENLAFADMLSPSDGPDQVIEHILSRLLPRIADACPPVIVGVGLGGGLDRAALLAKKALFREPGTASTAAYLADFEKKLKARLNSSGIGPFGLAGKLAVLSVQAEEAPCHIASLPVAVNVMCHSYRVGRLIYES
ncbi:MAG: fumarate hydratase [Candidatus Wallbacteria bacterium]|nr:fumarate hydratase [Candidatus Wallbacteria bacterium]